MKRTARVITSFCGLARRAFGYCRGFIERMRPLESVDEFPAGRLGPLELAPLRDHDRPAHERENREDEKNDFRRSARLRHQLHRRRRNRLPDLHQRECNHARCTACWLSDHAKVFARPSESVTTGSHPSCVLAFDASRKLSCCSPGRLGANTVSALLPAASLRSLARSITEVPIARPDVERARIHLRRCRELACRAKKHGARDVADVDVVACLKAIAENRERLSLQNASTENRDHSRFTVRILPWTVHISESQRRHAPFRELDHSTRDSTRRRAWISRRAIPGPSGMSRHWAGC